MLLATRYDSLSSSHAIHAHVKANAHRHSCNVYVHRHALRHSPISVSILIGPRETITSYHAIDESRTLHIHHVVFSDLARISKHMENLQSPTETFLRAWYRG